MKKYAIVDMTDGDWVVDEFESAEKAIERADYEWGLMSRHDKARRVAYVVASSDPDEDGRFNLSAYDTVKQYTNAD